MPIQTTGARKKKVLMFKWFILILISLLSAKLILPYAFSVNDYSWMLNGDSAQVLVGWTYFLNSPWGDPLTTISNLSPGSGSTLLQTDSIPWLSLFFKYLTQKLKLGSDWNFYGLWLISCWILQGIFSILIATELKMKFETKWFLVIYLLFAPILIFRLGLDGFTTINLLTIIIGGSIIFSLGIIGHYLALIYDEIKQRPSFIINIDKSKLKSVIRSRSQ